MALYAQTASPAPARGAPPPDTAAAQIIVPAQTRLGRLFRFLSLLALGLASALAANAYLNYGDPDYAGATSNQWAIGLISGVALGWGTRIRWSEVPARIAAWTRLQRRQFWWGGWGLAAIAVLLFY